MIAAEEIEIALGPAVSNLSAENYSQSLAFYRFWIDIGQTYLQIPLNIIFDTIWKNRTKGSTDAIDGQLIHPTAHLIPRLASDAESDHILAPYGSGLQQRLSTRTLQEFFTNNLRLVCIEKRTLGYFHAEANLVAHWINLGYVEEVAIRDHILQSLISHPKLYDHQADALLILFKLAGATFEAYADTSVIDRCFELLRGHSYPEPYGTYYSDDRRKNEAYLGVRRELIQDVVALRERGWEGLPPPPTFTSRKPKPADAGKGDPAATPVATSLGLPSRDLEHQIPQIPPLESFVVPEEDTTPPSHATQSPSTSIATQSPSTSIATLSDFTIADTSDDESPIDPAIADPSDNEPLVDPTGLALHETFYLDDGNVEVLCGNTLFRVHAGALSFHSPALRRMFAHTNLVATESPNGCPRILASDSATDFATLLSIVYLPEFPERNKVPDFTTFSSLLRITTKYEMPAVRSRILEAVRDGYPENFEGLAPSKQTGERIFSGSTPHPNEVLNLFVQQKLTSALPIAYYMAARRGPNSLMDMRLPASARLSPKVLQVAINGLLALRGVELKEAHRLILGSRGSLSCSQSNCPSRNTGPGVPKALQKIVDRIADSAHSGTKILEVLSVKEVCGGDCVGFCENCVGGWEAGHADVRKNAWGKLPDMFGLNRRTHVEN